MDATCIFCQIARKELEARIVFEDEVSIGFLDNRPLFPGHVLLIPKSHFETLSDVPAELVPAIFGNTRLLAQAVETGMGAEGTFVAINNRVSQSVPHLHVHIVPRKKKDGLRGFFWPRNHYKDDQSAQDAQERIIQAIRSRQSA